MRPSPYLHGSAGDSRLLFSLGSSNKAPRTPSCISCYYMPDISRCVPAECFFVEVEDRDSAVLLPHKRKSSSWDFSCLFICQCGTASSNLAQGPISPALDPTPAHRLYPMSIQFRWSACRIPCSCVTSGYESVDCEENYVLRSCKSRQASTTALPFFLRIRSPAEFCSNRFTAHPSTPSCRATLISQKVWAREFS